nr:hypothetical protein [Gordonia humi]
MCDALIAAEAAVRANVHATPWAGELDVDDDLGGILESVYGAVRTHDQSWSHASLDSFHRPDRALADAHRLAAAAFGVDRTYFVSTGASAANVIASTAALARGGRVMLDPTAHQSLHFAVERDAGEVDLMATVDGRVDFDAAVDRLSDAVARGRPPDLVIVAASSYDGRRVDCASVLLSLAAAAAPHTRFLLDDAWCAIHTFAPQTRGPGPSAGVAALRAHGLGNPVLIVHSAHKTMVAMRQAAYLHLSVGNEPDLAARVSQSVFVHHTTSPSWPILASLDLARELAVRRGAQTVGRALDRAADLRRRIDAETSFHTVALDPGEHYEADPLRVHIAPPIGLDAEQCRRGLWNDTGVHLSRVAAGRLVAATTIGVGEAAVDALVDGLQRAGRGARGRTGPAPTTFTSAAAFVVAYPPGVPIATPFDQESTVREVGAPAGAEVFEIDPF